MNNAKLMDEAKLVLQLMNELTLSQKDKLGGFLPLVEKLVQNIINPNQLGPMQTLWIKELREHPERQMDGVLGEGSIEKFKACCLGQALVCLKGEEAFNNNTREIIDNQQTYYLKSFADMGLRSDSGKFKTAVELDNVLYGSLAEMNDSGEVKWSQIADYIEANPENVFVESK